MHTDTTTPHPATDRAPVDPPLELPPALREVLDATAVADRAIARLLRRLIHLQASGEVEAVTGLTVDHYLAQLGRVTRVDRNFLLAAADVLAAMPATLAQFAQGGLSWSQTRAIVQATRHLRVAERAELDGQIAAAAVEFATWDPDQIVRRVDLLATELDTSGPDDVDELFEQPDRPSDLLVLQPRLDGTGGKLYGDYHDPVAFGTIGNALTDQMRRPNDLEPSTDDASRARNRERIGQARADALAQICADALAGTDADGAKVPAKPLVTATVSLETLLGVSRRPGDLLTSMTGGRLRVDAATARRLIDDGGAALRTIVLDDVGRAIGVGYKTHVPPDWLRDTIRVLHATSTGPLCRQSSATADLDHVDPWPDGPTDVDNLTPESRPHHLAKHDGTWRVTVLADGTKRWRHVRSGLTVDRPLDTRPLNAPALQPPRPVPVGKRRP